MSKELERQLEIDGWLTIEQAAEYLQLSVSTLRRAVKAGLVRASRAGGWRVYRFRRVDLDAYMIPEEPKQ